MFLTATSLLWRKLCSAATACTGGRRHHCYCVDPISGAAYEQVSKVDPSTPEVDAKAQLVDKIKRFVDEKIVFANSMVVTNAVTKIEAGDVILTYGFSSVVFNIMLRAHKACPPCASHCLPMSFMLLLMLC